MRQRRIAKQLLLTGAILITVLAASSVSGQTPSTTSVCQAPPLQPTERGLGGAKIDCYTFDLPKGYYFRVRVEQHCVDVVLRLSDAQGGLIKEVDSPNGIQGPEILTIIVPETDNYRLEVKPSAGSGKYSIVQEALRPPTDADRKQIEAQAIIAQVQTAAAASPPAALELLQKAAELLQEIGDNDGAARMFFEAGFLANAVGNRELSLSFYNKARMLYKAIPNQFEEARTLTAVGAVYFFSGEMREAVGYFHQADQLMKDACPLDRADTQQGLAKAYLRLSEWEKSLESFNKALELFRAVPYPSGVAHTLSNIGLVHMELAQKQKALEKFKEALEVVNEHGFVEEEVAILNNIGRVYDDMGKVEDARRQFKLALDKAKEIRDKQAEVQPKDKAAEAFITLNLGKTYLDSGNGQEALARFEKARDLFKEAGDRFGEITAINFVGRAYSALDDKQTAREHFNLALRLFRNFGSKRGEALTFSNLMFVWRSLGNRRLAIFFGKQSINVFQQIRDTARRIDDESLRSFTTTVEGTYRALASLLLAENRVSEAQEVLGLLKQEEFGRFTRPSENSPSRTARQIMLDDEERDAALKYAAFEKEFTQLADRTAQLAREKVSLEQQGQTLAPEKLDALQKEKEELNERFTTFLQNLSEEFSAAKAEIRPEPPLTLTQVWQKRLAELGHGTVLVTTLLNEDQYHLILTTPDQQISRSQKISQKELSERVEALRRALRDTRTREDFLPSAREFYRMLIEPIAADLQRFKARTLLLSLDGELRYVPFGVLYDGERFLVEKYASAVVTLAQPPDNRRVLPETWRGLGVGVSQRVGLNPALPQVRCELRSVVADKTVKGCRGQGIFPGSILIDKKFSRVNFVAELKRKPELVHVATHFLLGSENDVNSQLLFGDGDMLKLADLRRDEKDQFNLSEVELLTLSACDTVAKDRNDSNGVEIENLGVTAQRRGAKAVLASLWYVQDNRTPELMEEFYRRYKDGKNGVTKAESLRQAQIKMLRQSKDTQGLQYLHPAYWGAFIILGNP